MDPTSITKTDNLSWDFITMELREFIKNWIAEGKDILVQMPTKKSIKEANGEKVQRDYAVSEYDDAIKDLLAEYVAPAVAYDGGAIEFLGFEDGIVTVLLQGSCAGCPSSTATLKGGIENLLKQYLPEVKSVVAENE